MAGPGTVTAGLGTQLQRGNGATPEVFTTIAKVTAFKGPSSSTTMLDTTALDTEGGFNTFIPSLKKGGDLTVTLDFMPDSDSHQLLLGDWENRTARDFQIIWPDGVTTWGPFVAYVSKWEPDVATEKILSASITLTISGDPGFVTET